MTYQEMQKAELEMSAAIAPPKVRKQRGATRAQLAYRAQKHCCVNCCEPFASHTLQQTLDCSNARS